VCDEDRIGLGKCLTVGYGGASERASDLITRENMLPCRMSANYFSKNLCAMWELADQIIFSCLVGWSIDQLVNQFVNLVSCLASSASANSYRDCLSAGLWVSREVCQLKFC